jgi:hypothetical protein
MANRGGRSPERSDRNWNELLLGLRMTQIGNQSLSGSRGHRSGDGAALGERAGVIALLPTGLCFTVAWLILLPALRAGLTCSREQDRA